MTKKTALEEQIKGKLADPENHAPILEAVMEVVKQDGSKGLKKFLKTWVEDIKKKEGI